MEKGTKVNVKSINQNGVVMSRNDNRVSVMMEDGTAKVFDISDIEMFGKGGKVGDCIEYIKNSQPIKNNGYYLHIDNMNNYVASNSVNTPKINSLCLITFNSGGQDNLKAVDTINSMSLASEIAKLLDIDIEIARIIVSEQITHSKPFTMSMLNDIENKNIIIADRDKIVCTNLSMKYAKGGEVESEFKVEVNQYIPYGSSMGKNYYYVTNSKGNTISKKTKKAYRGKQMNEYKFDTEKDAQKFANSMNKKYAKGGNAIEEMSIKEGMGAGKKTWVVSHPKVQEKGVYFQDEYSQDEAKNEFYENVLKTYKYAKGGNADVENNEMVLNNNKQIAHHTKELPNAIKGKKVPAWVVAKVNRSASDLSDATHYMDGQGESYAKGGSVELKWTNLSIGQRYEFLDSFGNEITPSSKEEYTKKAFRFLPKKIKEKFLQSKYADKYGLGGFLFGAAVGAGATYYILKNKKQSSSKSDKTKVAKNETKNIEEPKYKTLTAKEKDGVILLVAITKDGFDYAIRFYSDYKNINDKKFVSLRKDYIANVSKLEKYIESKNPIFEKYDLSTKSVLDDEGIEYGFLDGSKSDWKGVKDAKFQALLKSAKLSYNAFQKYIKTKYKLKSFNDDEIFDRVNEIEIEKPEKMANGGGVDDFKMSYDEMTTYEKSNHIHYNPMNSRWKVTKNGENKEFWNQEQAEKYAGFEFDDEKDSRYSKKRYEALFGYADGGEVSSRYNQWAKNIYENQAEEEARVGLMQFAREEGFDYSDVEKALQTYKYDTEENAWGELYYTKKAIRNMISIISNETFANGGVVYFKKFENDFSSTRRGGVKNYSVDIDLENGEQLRGGDLDFKDGNDALFLYERIKKKGEYQNEKIEDIQLIANFKNGDYESVDIPTFANGGGVGEKQYVKVNNINDAENILFYADKQDIPSSYRKSEKDGSYTVMFEKALMITNNMPPRIKEIIENQKTKYANGGGVNMHSKFDLNEKGNFSAKINNKDYEIIYRDDVSKLYDLFENGKKIKSSRNVRDLMQFPKQYADGGKLDFVLEYDEHCVNKILQMVSKVKRIVDYYVLTDRLVIVLRNELYTDDIDILNTRLKAMRDCLNVFEDEFEIGNKEGYKTLLLRFKNTNYAKGGRLTSNEDIIEAFLTSNREAKVGNLSTHYNEYDNQMLLRNYGTLIASRKGNNLNITSIKYSVTTTKITNMVNRMAKDKGLNVKYVEKFEDGGMTSSYCYEIGGL